MIGQDIDWLGFSSTRWFRRVESLALPKTTVVLAHVSMDCGLEMFLSHLRLFDSNVVWVYLDPSQRMSDDELFATVQDAVLSTASVEVRPRGLIRDQTFDHVVQVFLALPNLRLIISNPSCNPSGVATLCRAVRGRVGILLIEPSECAEYLKDLVEPISCRNVNL